MSSVEASKVDLSQLTVPGDEACEAQYKASPACEHRKDFLGIRVAERPWKPSDKGGKLVQT